MEVVLLRCFVGGPPGPRPTPWSACVVLDENSAMLRELLFL